MRIPLIVTVLGVLAAALVVGRVASLLPVLPGSPGPAAAAPATPATLSIVAPGSVSANEPPFTVEIWVQDVTDLALYEWRIAYDPDVIEVTDPRKDAVENGPFLGGTPPNVRNVQCFGPVLPPTLDTGNVSFGCLSTPSFGGPPGPDGSGVLSTVEFEPVASGTVSIEFVCGALGDRDENDIPIDNVGPCVAPVTPTATPSGPLATPTATSVAPATTSTPGPPLPTPTTGTPLPTPTPRPPTPTPEPTPPPESSELVDLFAGCNPVVSTYRDGTTVQTLTAAIAPPGTLGAMWKFLLGVWLAYSPAFPVASNLDTADFLDVVFLCVDAPGTFVRSLV